MQVKVFCTKCKLFEIIETADNLEVNNSNLNSIPSPIGGLTTYSVVHDNHTLIVDVDRDGNVRSEKLIERIGVSLEKILAYISASILKEIESMNENITVYIISEDIIVHSVILGVFQQLMLNIPDNISAITTVSSEKKVMEMGNFQFYVGKWSNDIPIYKSDKNIFAFHIEKDTLNQTIDYVNSLDNIDDITKIAFLFNPNLTSYPEWGNFLKTITTKRPKAIFSDIGDKVKIASSIFSILETSF